MVNLDDNFKMQPNESIEDYKTRICSLKDTKNVSWQEITAILNKTLHSNVSQDAYRKWYRKNNASPFAPVTVNVVGADSDALTDELNDKILELKVLKAQISDERQQTNANIRRLSREDTLIQLARESAKILSEQIKPNIPFKNKFNIEEMEQVAILQLSDVHYGIEIQNAWNTYNPEICKQRFKQLTDEVIKKLTLNKIKKLYLVNLGDMIAGRIHLQLRINSRQDVISQTLEISQILYEFIENLSHFVNVECYFTSDNHARLEPNIKDSLELENLSRVITYSLITRLESNPNVILHSEDESEYGADIVTFEVFDYNIACCHGHRDKPAQVIKNISLYTQKHYDLILSSHFHHLQINEDNRTIVIHNGSMMGTDDYAEKLRVNSKPSQNLIICSRKNPMECLYKIDLD